MHGRRIYHARGKILGGSSSINGMIFQRGNPMDYERWAADPGMATWDFAHCLPYFRRMEDALDAAAGRPWRGHGGPLPLERGPATNPLFDAFFAAAREAGYPPTADVNGYRQEGFAKFDRNIRRGPADLRRARVPAPGDEPPQPRRPHLGLRDACDLRGDARRRCRVPDEVRRDATRACGRGDPRGRLDQFPAAAATLRRGECRGPGRPRHPGRRGPAGGRGEPPGSSRGLRPVPLPGTRLDAAGAQEVAPAVDRPAMAAPAEWPGCHQPLRGWRVRPEQRRRGVPEPPVPLPPAGDPVRRVVTQRRARLPGPCRADVLGRARFGEDPDRRSHGAPRASLQLPVHGQGPPRVGGGDPRGAAHPQSARTGPLQRG